VSIASGTSLWLSANLRVRAVLVLLVTSRPPAQHVVGAVRGDAVQPAREPRAILETSEVAVGAKESLLHDVLGVLLVSSHPIREAEDGAAVALDQDAKGAFVALAESGDRVGIGIACLHPVH